MKYVPGPIGALRDQAEIVGLKLDTGPGGALELQREGRRPIPITGWGKRAWSQMVRSHINDDMIRDLHNDVRPEQNKDGSHVPPRRKDMVGITPHVGRMATLALLQDKLNDLPKEVKKAVEVVDVANDINECKLATESIIAGSVRPNCSLARSHKMVARCRCENVLNFWPGRTAEKTMREMHKSWPRLSILQSTSKPARHGTTVGSEYGRMGETTTKRTIDSQKAAVEYS